MKIRTTYIICVAFSLMSNTLFAQKLSIEQCLSKAEEISPLSRQKLHFETLDELTQQNVSNAYLPAFFINGQASYQSDVFSFPNNPVFDSPIIPKEQFRVTLDVNQKIYDGGLTKNQKAAESARIMNDLKSVEVELYEIKTTISKLYFSALIYQENIKILNTLMAELVEQQKLIDSRVKNGVILISASNEFRKQILTTEQKLLSAQLEQKSLLEMLEKWVGEPINSSNELIIPNTKFQAEAYKINRPEVQLLETQHSYFESMKNLSEVKRRPTFWAVAQAGFGQPNAYNFLETDVSDFYYVGLKMSWHLFDYGNNKREKSIFTANQAIVDAKKEYLEDNIEIQLGSEKAEVDKLRTLLKKDDQILSLQTDIVKSSFSQFSNGVITSTDYISQLNSKTQLELTRQLRIIQLLQAEYNCLNITGNL